MSLTSASLEKDAFIHGNSTITQTKKIKTFAQYGVHTQKSLE